MCVPVAEELIQIGDCCELLVMECGQGVFHCRREKIKSTNDEIPLHDSGLGKMIMHELHRVIEEEGLGGGVNYAEAAVVVDRGADVESFAAT